MDLITVSFFALLGVFVARFLQLFTASHTEWRDIRYIQYAWRGKNN